MPVPETPTIAGWRASSSSVVVSALRNIARFGDADVCSLVWQAGDGEVCLLSGVGDENDELDRRSWLRQASAAAGGKPVVARDGITVALVPGADSSPAGAFAIRCRSGVRNQTGALATSAAKHIALLLASSEAQAERATAYEALFEIGTQIQEHESRPETIFATIVNRARQLLQADLAYLGLVDARADWLRLKVTEGTSAPEFEKMALRVGTGIGGTALRERRPVAVADLPRLFSGMTPLVRRGLEAENVVSVICAPMLRDDGMLGALYVGTRTERHFDHEEAQLLAALAAQAAVAIENARLYTGLAEKNKTLEEAFSIHRVLTDAALAGDGLAGITSQLARLVERDLLLSLVNGSPKHMLCSLDAARSPRALNPSEGEGIVESAAGSVPIVAGASVLGELHYLDQSALTPLQQKALEHGSTVIALELVKEQAAMEVAWRLQGELLEELLGSPGPPSESLQARARHFGVDLEQPRFLVVLKPEGEVAPSDLLDFVRRSVGGGPGRGALVAQRGDRIVLAVVARDAGEARDVVEDLGRRAGKAGHPFRAGISDRRDDLQAALRDATGALTLALRTDRPGALVSYEDLGPLRFMLDAPDVSGMVELVRSALGALAEHDSAKQAELMSTLRDFLGCGGHHRTTAAARHIHVSTLKYRLGKISEVLNCDLGDPKTRFELSLAFEVLAVLQAAGMAPFAEAPS